MISYSDIDYIAKHRTTRGSVDNGILEKFAAGAPLLAGAIGGALLGSGAGYITDKISPADKDLTKKERRSRKLKSILRGAVLGSVGGSGAMATANYISEHFPDTPIGSKTKSLVNLAGGGAAATGLGILSPAYEWSQDLFRKMTFGKDGVSPKAMERYLSQFDNQVSHRLSLLKHPDKKLSRQDMEILLGKDLAKTFKPYGRMTPNELFSGGKPGRGKFGPSGITRPAPSPKVVSTLNAKPMKARGRVGVGLAILGALASGAGNFFAD